MKHQWWAVAEHIGKEKHLVGVDCSVVDIPDLFRTKKAANEFIAAWKRENPIVKTWGLHAVRVTIQEVTPQT